MVNGSAFFWKSGLRITLLVFITFPLRNHAKIKKEVVVSSAVNILEIWDKTYYENAIDDAKFDFGNLAEEVMGDKDE